MKSGADMQTKRILLTRQWDGHAAGEVVEEWVVTVDSMIRKGYGLEVKPEPKPARREPPAPETTVNSPRGPVVETATAQGPPEQAIATPQISKSKGKGPQKAGK
jgi:hypothetical protein